MNEIQEIDVVITADGKLTVDIHGAKGPACLTFTREMEALLGGQVLERDLNYEYYEQAEEQGRSTQQTLGGF